MMPRYLISLSWPKGAPRIDRVESTVELEAIDQAQAGANARAKWAEHDVVAVTLAELQPDGRWTFPRD